MSKLLCFILCLLWYVLFTVGAAKILAVYPLPSRSHQYFYRTLTIELLKRGHELVVITTDPEFHKDEAPTNLTEIDVHDMSYKFWDEKVLTTSRGDESDAIYNHCSALSLMIDIFENQLKNTEIRNLLLEKNTFDLVLVEPMTILPLALSHIFKVPVIQIGTGATVYGNFECIGASVHPILYSAVVKQRIDNLTIWEKLTELRNYYTSAYYLNRIEEKSNIMTKNNFGNNFPTFDKLYNNVDMLFLNMHPIWDLNRPIPLSVTYISGVHQVPPKELPEDLKQYLDSSRNGVIYVSFGTNTKPSTLKPHFIKILLKVFSELPYDILIKWDIEELPGKSPNIKVLKWFPQPDVLRHPKVKLFITQGGIQSTDEAIAAGVPLIGIPMIADQWFNTEHFVKHKIGLKLNLDTLTEEEFKSAVTSILNDKSFYENMIKFRTLVSDQPQLPITRAMWWIEHVLRHSGAKHLQAPTANVTWAQYMELELMITLLSSICLMFCTLVYTTKKLVQVLVKIVCLNN